MMPVSILSGKKEADVTEISYIRSIWKGNHILIEFSPMVANARVRLHMDTPGCKSRGAVAKQTFIARYKNFAVEFIVPIEFSSALRRIHSVLQRQSPSQI